MSMTIFNNTRKACIKHALFVFLYAFFTISIMDKLYFKVNGKEIEMKKKVTMYMLYNNDVVNRTIEGIVKNNAKEWGILRSSFEKNFWILRFKPRSMRKFKKELAEANIEVMMDVA